MRSVKFLAGAIAAAAIMIGAAIADDERAAQHPEPSDNPPVPSSVLLVIGGAIGLYSASRSKPRKR